jgi:hypothetical protein
MLRGEAAGGTLASERVPVLTIAERWDAGVAIATVRGEIDITTVGTLSEHLGHRPRRALPLPSPGTDCVRLAQQVLATRSEHRPSLSAVVLLPDRSKAGLPVPAALFPAAGRTAGR